MELRAVQTALLAGRTASRWATTSTSTSTSTTIASITLPSTATFARHISSSRSRRQEAEASAPAPPESQRPAQPSPPPAAPASMAAYAQRREQQQKSDKQKSDMEGLRSMFSDDASSSSSSSSFSLAPLQPRNNNVATWARPSSATTSLARNQRKTTEVINTLFSGTSRSVLDAPLSRQDLFRLNERDRPQPEDIKLRLRPVLGRGVGITDSMDFARALEVLGQRCSANRVAVEARAQKFHERPGLKRKRLKSQRWRMRFRHGFRATADRVNELAKQGW